MSVFKERPLTNDTFMIREGGLVLEEDWFLQMGPVLWKSKQMFAQKCSHLPVLKNSPHQNENNFSVSLHQILEVTELLPNRCGSGQFCVCVGGGGELGKEKNS